MQRKLQKDCACIITVVTKDGTKHETFDYLPADAQGVQFSRTLQIPRESIVEIRIQPELFHFNPIFAAKEFVDGACDPKCGIQLLWVAPAAVAMTGIITPMALITDGVRRLKPRKVIRLAP